ncbi:MAG: hypothetical protein GEV13_15760 [Rhodospirillales bacterium]|nr:hypothetical protein [Rhodospirillales bacterium]
MATMSGGANGPFFPARSKWRNISAACTPGWCARRPWPASGWPPRPNARWPTRWSQASSRALADQGMPTGGIYAVYPTNRLLASRVRLFVDHIARDLRARSLPR